MRTSDFGRAPLAVLLLSVVLNAAGQLLFKAGRVAIPEASLGAVLLRIEIWVGLVLYGLSSITWLWVLARVPLSYAYPILALSFPIVVALSAVFFLEEVSAVQAVGVGLILAGVSVLPRS